MLHRTTKLTKTQHIVYHLSSVHYRKKNKEKKVQLRMDQHR